MRFLSVFFLLLFLCVSSWSACTSGRWNQGNSGFGSWACCSDRTPNALDGFSKCPSTVAVYGGIATDLTFNLQNTVCAGYWGQCGQTTTVVTCTYAKRCDTQVEADSVNCENRGKFWVNGECKEFLCDSTKYTCNTTTETTQTTIASEDVTCFNGSCFGGVYCEYVTRNSSTCTNECGTSYTEVAEFPMRYDGACNEETAPDEDLCSSQKCMTNNGFYHLYRVCSTRNFVNGQSQMIPVFEGGGLGTCANAGYKEENPNMNSSNPSLDSSSVPKECYTMGINCPAVSDTTNYTLDSNRTSQNGCICKPYDGQSYISQIICPDGSRSIFYGPCDEYNKPPSSSSNAPESSSSGSENPPASSGAAENSAGDWVNYSQGEEIKSLLGQIVLNTEKQNEISVNVNSQSANLTEYDYNGNDGEYAGINRTDSIYNPLPDTSGFLALRDSILSILFSKVDSNNHILDTIQSVSFDGCPTLKILGGAGNIPTTQSGVRLEGFTINFCSVYGFNLKSIISVIVTSFASVVGFFIGFSIFKNVSQ